MPKRTTAESEIPLRKRRQVVEDDESDQAEEELEAQSSQASTGKASISDPDQDNSDHGERDEASDEELCGITADTQINSRRQSQKVVQHIRNLRRIRRENKKKDKLMDKLEKKQAKFNARRDREDEKRREFILSITLEWSGAHVPLDVFTQFQSWLATTSEWWAAAYEKGSTLGLWHIQAVAVISEVGIAAIKKSWYVFSGWDVNRPKVRKVNLCIKEAKGKGLHTRIGLLGYSRKDCDKYEGHLWSCSPTVTPEEMQEGDLLFCQFGKGDKGNSCQLTETNLLDRAIVYWERFIKDPLVCELDHVLSEMLRTGRYSIHGKFFTSNGAWSFPRAQLAFMSRLVPADTRIDDVKRIFFTIPKPRDDTAPQTPQPCSSRDISRPCTPRKSDPFARKCSYVPFDDDDDSDDDDLVHSVNIAATSRTLSRSSTVRTLDFDIDTRPDNSIQPDSVIDRLGCTTTSISDRPFSDPTVESIMSRHRPSSPVLQDRSCELQPKYTQPLSCDFFGSAEFECDIAPTGS